jgi:methyl-accepting chemotaxis protein
LVAHRSPAEVQSARFLRRLSMMGYATTARSPMTALAAGRRGLQGTRQGLWRGQGEPRQDHRRRSAAAEYTTEIKGKLDAIYADARSAADLAQKNDDVGAIGVLTRVDPAIDALAKQGKAWGDVYNKETAAMVAKASKSAARARG